MKYPTKYYSSKQEKMIADYLGWSVVVASGARPFNPGDIKSNDYLCECKTHTSEQKRISIKKSVWNKISIEAMSTFKKPALFVDNGTQKADDTWCIIRKPCYFTNGIYVGLQGGVRESETQISFDHSAFKSFLSDKQCAEICINGESLILMKLKTFKTLIEE